MNEKIYTIPLNEEFSKTCGCAMCRLYNNLEKTELETILGAAMMEPDVRIKTNKLGFCKTHYDMMFEMKYRLGLALMLESHLDTLKQDLSLDIISKIFNLDKTKRLGALEESCYVCEKVDFHYGKMISNLFYLYEQDMEFRKKIESQPYICLPHFKLLLERAKDEMSKKWYVEFKNTLENINKNYLTELKDDVTLFCRKFDYRYDDEPWGNSKDSVERSIKFLRGDLHSKK